ncbi:unnamed protein product, partial [Caenorhabditis brenneri]
MAQSALIAQLDNLQSELNAAYARNQRLVVAVDEISRLSLGSLDLLRIVQEKDLMVIDLQQLVAQLEGALAAAEQRENMLAGELGRSLRREADLQTQ